MCLCLIPRVFPQIYVYEDLPKQFNADLKQSQPRCIVDQASKLIDFVIIHMLFPSEVRQHRALGGTAP